MIKSKNVVLKVAVIYLFYTMLMCFIISRKANLNIDELANYTLSNAYNWFDPEDGIIYSPADIPFIESMASNGHIDFGHVWKLQVQDGNHPPFYYALNHVFCSVLAPGKISMWPSGILNIIFQLLSLYFIRKMFDIFKVDETAKMVMTLVYMFCGGVLSLVAFYRMYTMLMFLVIVFNYLLIKNISKFTRKNFIELFALTVTGALTQYYFLFCAFFSSLVFGIILIREKRLREAVWYVVTMGLAGITSLLIFPEIRWQLMPSGFGGIALENMSNSSTAEQIKIFLAILNQQLFGKLVVVLIVVLVTAIMYCVVKKRSVELPKTECQAYAVLLISSVGVFCIVAKSAFVNSDRYISPIYSLVFVLVYTVLYKVLSVAAGKKSGICCL